MIRRGTADSLKMFTPLPEGWVREATTFKS